MLTSIKGDLFAMGYQYTDVLERLRHQVQATEDDTEWWCLELSKHEGFECLEIFGDRVWYAALGAARDA